MRELWAFYFGVPIFFIGGAGSIWFYYKYEDDATSGMYHIFDREKGVIRTTIKENGKKRIKEFPFEECYARLARQDNVDQLLLQKTVSIHHPSYAGMLHLERFNDLDAALGHWSFLVQYMDNQAPLPNVGFLASYPNRTDGVGPPDKWKAIQARPGFVDPYFHWRNLCRLHQGQGKPFPEDLPEQYTPRAQVRVDQPGPGEKIQDQRVLFPDNMILPKRLLRPFTFQKTKRADEKRYYCKRILAKGRYYALATWTLLSLGPGLLVVSRLAGLAPILIAGLSFWGLWYVRQTRGLILDRENGNIILHKGWLLKPLVLPFDQCRALLISKKHPMGFSTSRLYIEHPQAGLHALDDGHSATLNMKLGFWSFIVQYMDKTKSLPAGGPFENMPDTEPGLGGWEDWSAKATQPGFVDPFARWLSEPADKGKQEVSGDQNKSAHNRSTVQTSGNPPG